MKYFDNKKNEGEFHDLDQEAQVFSDIVRQFSGELHMTPEVESLVDKFITRGNRNKAGSLKFRFYQALSQKLLKKGFHYRRRAERAFWLNSNQGLR